MKLAVIGSRNIQVVISDADLPNGVDEIVSGGAVGVDRSAAKYAKEHHIKLTEFLPDYDRYGRCAPLKRNEQIADYADEALAFWNGSSRGTLHTIRLFQQKGKRVTVIKIES